MSHHDWLTQDELLQELGRNGIELSERTFRFWIAQNVLDGPVKKPYRGADGRVGFYPRRVLTLIPEVLRLQEEGWKLRQIRLRLSAPPEPVKVVEKSVSQQPPEQNESGQTWAERYLQDLLSDTESRDRRRCFSSTGAASSELRQVRHYLVARLERWVGRSIAVRATSAFLLNLSQRDFQRLLSRLRVPTSVRLAQLVAQTEAEPALHQFPENDTRARLLQTVELHQEALNNWKDYPKAPVLLSRTLETVQDLHQLLQASESSPESLERLNQTLSKLAEIEQQAQADLAFLQLEKTSSYSGSDP